MSTRRADPNAPLSQEKYMSSPEFAGLQGISGTAVAKRCALLVSPAKRQLLWFIQGLSLLKGGCKTLASELQKMFPERVGTHNMHKLGMAKGQRYTGREVTEIEMYLCDDGNYEGDLDRRAQFLIHEHDPVSLDDSWDDRPVAAPPDFGPPVPWQNLYAKCFEAAKARLPDFLTELCINPAVEFLAPGEPDSERPWPLASVSYFQDIIGALFEYKRRYEERVKAEFCLTAIGQQVWKQLDAALKSRRLE